MKTWMRFFVATVVITFFDVHAVMAATHYNVELTPLGAIRSGNLDGSIPEWNANELSESEHFEWMKAIQNEKPIDVIKADSLDQYPSLLSPGVLKLFESYPDTFFMPVYKTHRTATQPEWTYVNAVKNITDAKLSESGDELLSAWSGTPFPIPNTPHQIMWNHQTRWKGLFIKLHLYETTVYPNSIGESLETEIETFANFYQQDRESPDLEWRNTYYFSRIMGPSRLAGGALLVHESLQPIRRPRQAWLYVAGERRMRRTPTMGYDSPLFNSDGIRLADEIDMFNGPLDRYDWTLVGRREMLIPYNNQKMRYNKCNDQQALTPFHLSPNAMRFEKHRVWIVDSTLKPDAKHAYKRRTFYVDEDTWSIVMVDTYDKNDDLWRVNLRFPAYYEEMPGVFSGMDSNHDLHEQSYFVQCSAGRGTEFSMDPPPKSYFTPANIRQRLRR